MLRKTRSPTERPATFVGRVHTRGQSLHTSHRPDCPTEAAKENLSMKETRRPLNFLIGLSMQGAAVTGALALIAALIAVIQGQFLAAGLCLLAAATAFGLLAIAILRGID